MYVPEIVDATTPRSGRLMNLFETQFLEAKALVDIHLHDDLYYEIPEADDRYFWSLHMGSGIGPDADMVDGKHWDELTGTLLPPGIGFAWNLTEAEIPDYWHIGDGSIINGGPLNGKYLPETRNLFLMGAGLTYQPLATGGSIDTGTTAKGWVNIAGHILDISEIPLHTHQYWDLYAGAQMTEWCMTPAQPDLTASSKDLFTNYNHENVADEAHTHGDGGYGWLEVEFPSFSIIPPYIAKCIIFKTR